MDSSFIINGKNCSEWIDEDACNCKRFVGGFPVTTLCCASCEMVNTGKTGQSEICEVIPYVCDLFLDLFLRKYMYISDDVCWTVAALQV